MKVYGPYKRKDGRKHVILWDGIRTKTVSYPKYLMEQHLGRDLLTGETVDHIDGDFTNDSLENLQVLSRRDNILKALGGSGWVDVICHNCGKVFRRRRCHMKKVKRQFCRTSCVAETYRKDYRKYIEAFYASS